MRPLKGFFTVIRYIFLFAVILLGLVSIIGTGSSSNSSKSSGDDKKPGAKGEQFLSIHTNENGNIGEGAYTSVLRIEGDECIVEVIDHVYPPQNSFQTHTRGHGEFAAVGLHTDFIPRNTRNDQEMWHIKGRGAWFNTGDNASQTLPLRPPAQENQYTAIHGRSIEVSPSGHIFYRTHNKSDYYFTDDEYHYIVRFEPDTGIAKHTDYTSAVAFLSEQPETNTPYGNIWVSLSDTIYASISGRYVYGTITPRSYYGGTWYGAGPSYLFEYDFKEAKFRRLGDPEDSKSHTLAGITNDNRHLVYRHEGVNKRINLETNEITVLVNAPGLSGTLRSSWNSSGVVFGQWWQPGTLVLYFYNLLADEEPARLNAQPSIGGIGNSPYVGEIQISSDGSNLYFILKQGARYFPGSDADRIDAEPNTLYVMKNFRSDNPQTEPVCLLPYNVHGINLIPQ